MELTTAWVNYVNRLSAIDQTATDKVGTFLTEFNRLGASGFDYGNPKHMQALINYAYGVSTTYGEAAAALACEMYDAVGLASGVFVEPAVPVDPPNIKDVAATIIDAAGARNNNIVASRVGRMVKKNGIDTVVQNAKRDGAEVAWVPRGDSCAFCITLASRGWQNANYYVEHIHSNCDCTLATRFNGKTSIKGYDPQKYKDIYYGAEGSNSKDKINSIRRIKYQENKDRINAQKRAAYAKRQALNNLYTYDDPIREKLGSAYTSHPSELSELKKHIMEKGVEIREMGTDMAYCPNPTSGKPGMIKMDSEASYSAWLHEYQHILDDEESGWQGYRLFSNPQTVAELEDKAYNVEIDFAKSLGYTKIAQRLEWLKGERRREVYGKPKRRNKNT